MSKAKKRRIIILHSEIAPVATLDEQDTLKTALAIQTACLQLGWETNLLPCTAQLLTNPSALQHDAAQTVVFNLTETINNSCQLNYQGALIAAQAGMPYTGGTPLSIWLSTDKIVTKQLLKAWQLPTPDWLVVNDNYAAIETMLTSGPVVIKPVNEEGSVGIQPHCYIQTPRDLQYFRDHHAVTIQHWFAERYIPGREFNLALLAIEGQPFLLPIKEIQFLNWDLTKPKIVDYAAKWQESSEELKNTVNNFNFSAQDAGLLQQLQNIALQSWRLLQLNGYVRLDVRVDDQQQPWILEVNVNPAIAPEAGFFAAAQRAGYNYTGLIHAIVEDAFFCWQQAASPFAKRENSF